MQEVQAALREEVESVERFAYLRVAFPERTLEPGLSYCTAPVVPFTLGMIGLVKRKLHSSVGVKE